MRQSFQHFALVLLLVAGCARSTPPAERPALSALLRETKFAPRIDYTGADTPEDLKPLQTAVDGAIKDIRAMPDPMRKELVRNRLSRLIKGTNLYATEDRDEVGRYAIRIWRAAGFRDGSGLFPVSDERVLAPLLSRSP